MLIPLLSKEYEVITYEIPHHGKSKDSELTFEISALVSSFIDFMYSIGPSYVYVFSLGGYLAISAAQIDQTNFKGIVTQGTKFNWSKEAAEKETETLNVEFLSSTCSETDDFYKLNKF